MVWVTVAMFVMVSVTSTKGAVDIVRVMLISPVVMLSATEVGSAVVESGPLEAARADESELAE